MMRFQGQKNVKTVIDRERKILRRCRGSLFNPVVMPTNCYVPNAMWSTLTTSTDL